LTLLVIPAVHHQYHVRRLVFWRGARRAAGHRVRAVADAERAFSVRDRAAVTPIVAIRAALSFYVDSTTAALLSCAVIVAFFPAVQTADGRARRPLTFHDRLTLSEPTPWQRLAGCCASGPAVLMRGLKISVVLG